MDNSLPFPHFLTSATRLDQCPPDGGHEAAFAGRSNAGKSSALNAIFGVRGLARTSKTPGRTQLLNFFAVGAQARVVDLPGYGYARVPVAVRGQWQHFIEEYLAGRRSLSGLVLIVDIRRGLLEPDLQLLHWCGVAGVPGHVLLTKADKLSRGAAAGVLSSVRHRLARDYPGASAQTFSSLTPSGIDEARAVLQGWLGCRIGDAPPGASGKAARAAAARTGVGKRTKRSPGSAR